MDTHSSETDPRIDGDELETPREPGSDERMSDEVHERILIQQALDILEPLHERSAFKAVGDAVLLLRKALNQEQV